MSRSAFSSYWEPGEGETRPSRTQGLGCKTIAGESFPDKPQHRALYTMNEMTQNLPEAKVRGVFESWIFTGATITSNR